MALCFSVTAQAMSRLGRKALAASLWLFSIGLARRPSATAKAATTQTSQLDSWCAWMAVW